MLGVELGMKLIFKRVGVYDYYKEISKSLVNEKEFCNWGVYYLERYNIVDKDLDIVVRKERVIEWIDRVIYRYLDLGVKNLEDKEKLRILRKLMERVN